MAKDSSNSSSKAAKQTEAAPELRKLSLRRAANERQAERLERRLLNKVETLLDEAAVWQAVEKIAAELLARETISGRAARHLFDECRRDAE